MVTQTKLRTEPLIHKIKHKINTKLKNELNTKLMHFFAVYRKPKKMMSIFFVAFHTHTHTHTQTDKGRTRGMVGHVPRKNSRCQHTLS